MTVRYSLATCAYCAVRTADPETSDQVEVRFVLIPSREYREEWVVTNDPRVSHNGRTLPVCPDCAAELGIDSKTMSAVIFERD